MLKSFYKVTFIDTKTNKEMVDYFEGMIPDEIDTRFGEKYGCVRYKITNIHPVNKKYNWLLVDNKNINNENVYSLLSQEEIESLRFDDLSREQIRDIIQYGENIEYFLNRKIICIKKK